MAEPTIPYVDALSNNASSVLIADNAAMQVGDLRVVIISISTSTITTPTGWDLVNPTPILFQTSRRIYVFTRTHPGTGTETDHTFTFSAAANYSAIQLGIRGWDTGAPINVAPALTSGGTGTNISSPSATPSVADTLVLRIFVALLNSSSITMSDPTGTTRLDYQAGTGTAGHCVLCSKDTTPPAAGVGSGIKASVCSASSVWAGVTMVIAPAQPVTFRPNGRARRRRRPMFRR